MNEKRYIRVSAKLKATQFVGYNKWEFTLNGEKRTVLSDRVEYLCKSFDSAIKSFNEEEIESIEIKWDGSTRFI